MFVGEGDSSSCHGETEQLEPSATANGGAVRAVPEPANRRAHSSACSIP